MTTPVPFACACGTVLGHVNVAPRSGRHLSCACDSCRASEVHLGQPDPGAAGVMIFQTTPDRVQFEAGQDRLAVQRLSPKGLNRWYATYCNSPLCNTLAGPGFPFVGFLSARMSEPAPLGPIMSRANIPNGTGKPGQEHVLAAGLGLMRRALVARLTGRWKKTPFFDVDTKTATAPIHVISLEEKEAALAALRD